MPAVSPRTRSKIIVEVIRRNRLFTAVLVVATLLRIDAELGYRWQSWFNDSWDYVDTAVTLNLDPTRPSGYSLYMFLLRPFHSFALVTISQHLMGLLVGVMIYALAKRRFSCPTWLAVVFSVPVLLDGFEIQLEHLIMSDTLFLFLAMLSLFVLLWSPLRAPDGKLVGGGAPSKAASWSWKAPWRGRWRASAWVRCGVSGLLLGLSATVRSTGLPLIPVIGVWLLVVFIQGRIGWRTAIASLAAFVVTVAAPSVAYAGWYDLQHGNLQTSESTGIFLYSRVMTFAECSKMGKLPTDLLPLCTSVPPSQRPLAQEYIWESTTPLDRFPGSKFSPLPNSLAQEFAIKAMEAQPLAYAQTIFDDSWRAFYWPRSVFPNAATYDEYLFGYESVPVASGHAAGGYASSAQAYLAGSSATTQLVQPFAGLIRVWQRYVWLPGTVYGLILLAGLAGLIITWRRRGRPEDGPGSAGAGGAGLAALLPWLTSLALIVVPAATAEFDYRYVTTAAPFACLALAMVIGPARGRLPFLRRAGGEAGGTASLPGSVAGSGLGNAATEARHDESDLTTDASSG
jgi:hypothetical protein